MSHELMSNKVLALRVLYDVVCRVVWYTTLHNTLTVLGIHGACESSSRSERDSPPRLVGPRR